MRLASVTSGLLILVFYTSTFGCVTGHAGKEDPCSGKVAHKACKRTKPGIRVTRDAGCGDFFKSVPDKCSLRGLLQFQFVALDSFQMPSPSLNVGGEVSLRPNSRFVASSNGSPETDRGPPAS